MQLTSSAEIHASDLENVNCTTETETILFNAVLLFHCETASRLDELGNVVETSQLAARYERRRSLGNEQLVVKEEERAVEGRSSDIGRGASRPSSLPEGARCRP